MNNFKIIIPIYNAEKEIAACLKSVLSQDYEKYSVIAIDDNSSDRTWDILNSFDNPRLTKIKNAQRVGALANIVHGISVSGTSSEDVIITVDGDDELYSNHVLQILDSHYQSGAWLTYGQFIPKSNSYGPYCSRIPNIATYRHSDKWLASHLRTFKRGLWNRISDSDLRDKSGSYYKTAWDAAFMFPMLEMAGDERAHFVPDILYIYNDTSPINDMKVNKQSQIDNASYIRSKPTYKKVESL